MRYHLATDKQLKHIFNHDKNCPTHILSGAITEMMNRNMLNGYILYAAESVNIQMVEREDILQIGLIELHECMQKFTPGKSTPKTFAHNCLRNRFKEIIEKQTSQKRMANYRKAEGEEFDDYLIVSPFNVEKYVLTKIETEKLLSQLPEKEKTVLIMYSRGYTYQEIADHFNYKDKTSTLQIIKRASKKIRKELEYEDNIHHKQVS